MGDHQQRHPLACQILLQPFDHVDIEVVGGLVENQHIRSRGDHGCDRCALELTAAEGRHQACEIRNTELSRQALGCLELSRVIRIAVCPEKILYRPAIFKGRDLSEITDADSIGENDFA